MKLTHTEHQLAYQRGGLWRHQYTYVYVRTRSPQNSVAIKCMRKQCVPGAPSDFSSAWERGYQNTRSSHSVQKSVWWCSEQLFLSHGVRSLSELRAWIRYTKHVIICADISVCILNRIGGRINSHEIYLLTIPCNHEKAWSSDVKCSYGIFYA